MRSQVAAASLALTLAAFAIFAASAAFASSASSRASAVVPLDTLLDRAAWYLDYFVDEFENVVAEERYVQDSTMPLPSFSPVGGARGGGFPPPPSPSDAARARHRDLRSDFLLVKSPDTQALVPFRDVIEVDGVAIRDREARLAKLFLSARGASVMEQAERIGAEGARYNLGNMRSTLGNPVLGLGVLQRTYQARFRFTLAKDDRASAAGVSVVEFKETASPAMIRGEAGRDLMAHGRVTMGSGSSEIGRNDDEAMHDVEITRPFLIGQYEVTQQEWRTVMGTAPSHFSACGSGCPVENVAFDDVQQFIAKLNAHVARSPESVALRQAQGDREQSRTVGSRESPRYRLPTEAEWEYACRARTAGPFSTGENLTTAQANYNGKLPYASFPAGEFRQKPTPAGTFPLNPWGLGDMHGNVWEWTADWYAPYPEFSFANIDPHGPASGEKRVIRGGSWYFDANSARCGLRYTHAPQDKGFSLGFRVAADRVR